jgi:hypothetical protein
VKSAWFLVPLAAVYAAALVLLCMTTAIGVR